jgi:FG-GAP repeat/Putative Ig domain
MAMGRRRSTELTRRARFGALGAAVVVVLSGATSAPAGSSDADLYPARILDPADQNSAFMGFSSNGGGDVNGDGYDDIVVGAPNWDGEQTDEGRVYIYFGSATGIQTTPQTLDPTDQASALFGWSAASAGDVNSDGYDDLLVGALFGTGNVAAEGRAYLYLGSSAGLQTTPEMLDPTDQTESLFGHSVSGAGDLNADGYDDVVVGAIRWDGEQIDEGRAFVYFGSATGLQVSPVTLDPANQAEAYFGFSVSGAGDINSDGFDDLVVGTPRLSNGQAGEGAIMVFLGTAAGLNVTPTTFDPTNQAFTDFGASVDGAGDVNSDGYDDVIAGAPIWDGQQTDEGRAFLYLGSASGLQASPKTLDPTDQLTANFGHSVGGAGDLNSDGYNDVVVGSNLWDGQEVNEGRAYIYLGGVTGLESGPSIFDPTDQAGARFAKSVGGAGDTNGDAYDEVVVGVERWNAEETDEGRAYLFMRRIAPVFEPVGEKVIREGERVRLKVRATDANGDSLTYSASDLPSTATFDPATRVFNWTANFDEAGDYEAKFSVSDGARSDHLTVDISVLDRPSPTLTIAAKKSGKKITASGKLTPTHEGEDILVTLSKKVSGNFKKVITNRDAQDDTGAYVTTFNRPSGGSCKVRAFFRGDDDHAPVGANKAFAC